MILASGVFDGLHGGHVRYLRAAHFLRPWDWFAVAISPDGYAQDKHGRPPTWTQAERAQTVEAIRWVNSVILQGTHSVASVIRLYQPAVFVKGADWRDRLPTDVMEACLAAHTEIVFVDTPGLHNSESQRPSNGHRMARGC